MRKVYFKYPQRKLEVLSLCQIFKKILNKEKSSLDLTITWSKSRHQKVAPTQKNKR